MKYRIDIELHAGCWSITDLTATASRAAFFDGVRRRHPWVDRATRSEQIQEPPANPAKPKCSLQKATMANTMTPSGILASRVASPRSPAEQLIQCWRPKPPPAYPSLSEVLPHGTSTRQHGDRPSFKNRSRWTRGQTLIERTTKLACLRFPHDPPRDDCLRPSTSRHMRSNIHHGLDGRASIVRQRAWRILNCSSAPFKRGTTGRAGR
jgi:hypothetical protein